MTPRLLPLLLVAASTCCVAADGDRVQAARLRDEARALRAQAEDRLRAAEPACYERFLVNRCLAEAKEARLETIRRARELETEASRLELAEKQREAAERSPAAPAQQPAPPSASDRDVVPDAAAEAIRRGREAQAGRDAAAAQARQREEDAEKAREHAEAESDAARRANAARRDRERYDERIRRREQEKREN